MRIWPRGPYGLKQYEALVDVVQPLDQAPVFAIGDVIRSTNICGEWTGIGEYGIGISASYQDTTTNILGWSPWATPTALTTKVVSSSADVVGNPISVSLSASRLFLGTIYPFSTDVMAFDTRAITVPSTPSRLPGVDARPVPDGAFVLDAARVQFLHNDGSYDVTITAGTPHFVSWVALDRLNANTLVWVESDAQANVVNPVIWTAPYSTSAAGLTRRKVAQVTETEFRGLQGTVANAGVALSVVGKTSALLTRLSDGMGWLISAEPGDGFIIPLWVDDNELWISTGDVGVKSFEAYGTGIFRLSRSGLGPPTVPRGF